MNDVVMIAVDPHKASNTAAVLDPVSKTVIKAARFANTAAGYAQLTAFAARWGGRRWAVEGCHGAGRSLARRLAADGELVLDVPAKLAARVRVYSRGHGRKTDKDDAVWIGLAALDGAGVVPVTCDGALVSLRLLCDRREELLAQRTQAPAPHRSAGHNQHVRITYDPAADAACISLTGDPLTPGRTTIQAPTPPGTSGFIALDWKNDRLAGIEILDASARLHHDLLEQADITS